jgi:hypothetical protein
MSKQHKKETENKITRLHLQAFLLREEGATRHIICRYMTIISGHARYRRKQTRCNHCSARYSNMPDHNCLCCGYQLRRVCRWKSQSAPECVARERNEI